jgi:uncharacterized protein YbaR (Trm112 family)
MVSPDLLDYLRCPFDPSHTRLEPDDGALVCTSCRLRFPVKEGIPSLLVEGAELPPGCPDLGHLPCQQAKPAGGPP